MAGSEHHELIVVLLFYIQEVSASSISPETSYSQVAHSFHQSLQANTMIVT
jgi:hypothetical protein